MLRTHHVCRSCVLVALLALGTAPALAQSARAERPYVSGSVLFDIKRFSGDTTNPVLDGESLGGGLTVGTGLHHRWDLQVGVDVPRFTSTSHERLVTLQKTTFTLHSITRNQPLSVTTLLRFHGAQFGGVRLGYLGGVSFVRLRRDAHTEAPANTPGGLIPKPDTSVEYSAAPTVGVDARIPLARHVFLVPDVRATVFRLSAGSGVLVRPRLGLRWAF